jgi:hypothetical protein
MPTLHATFFDRAAADRAIEDLIAQGISPDDISILMSSAAKEKLCPDLDGDVTKGGVSGAMVGGGLAALAGGLLLTAATGGAAAPFLVAGPIAGALVGGVSGVAVGTIVGGLTGAGLAETDARDVEAHLNNGAVCVAVKTTDEAAPDVDEILRKDNSGAEPTTT